MAPSAHSSFQMASNNRKGEDAILQIPSYVSMKDPHCPVGSQPSGGDLQSNREQKGEEGLTNVLLSSSISGSQACQRNKKLFQPI